MKDAIILSIAGAAGIYMARQFAPIGDVMDGGFVSNGKMVPIVPVNQFGKNGISLWFAIIPAAAAAYLSR